MHNRCEEFYDWFNDNKTDAFVNSIISPVHTLAALGCPPEKFTTNRSERTNGIIQDYVKREFSGSKVNEYVFTSTMQKLIDVQEKELAVVNRGEYKLRKRIQASKRSTIALEFNDGETKSYSLKENSQFETGRRRTWQNNCCITSNQSRKQSFDDNRFSGGNRLDTS